MANIINNNFHFYKLQSYKGEYWDFTLNKDMNQYSQRVFNKPSFTNLISYFDFTNPLCVQNNEIVGLENYFWNDAQANNCVLGNIGYTGFDNGLLHFQRDKIRNEDFVNLYQNSSYEIKEDDKIFKMHFVSGCTNQYSYDYQTTDDYIHLNGGFMQGFFKTECGKYEVLPSNYTNGEGLSLEFTLKPTYGKETRFPTLNDKNPSNKGIFFYIGARAENKWIYLYDKQEQELSYDDYIEDGSIDVFKHKLVAFNDMSLDFCDCNNVEKTDILFGDDYLDIDDNLNCEDNSGFEYVEDEMDISDFIYKTQDDVFTLGKYEEFADYNNPFLLFNRTTDGYHVGNWENGNYIRYVGNRIKKNSSNLFLLMNRTFSGYTVGDITKIEEENVESYDIYADLYENALAFRITDDGAIGYRYLIENEDKPNKLEIKEAYSKPNLIVFNEWNHIFIKIVFIKNKMQFKFYINGNLIFISQDLPILNLRQLDEIYEKQETVPFNLSVGGGTQGLAETILPNYMITPYRTYPLEQYFAGTFIGDIKNFKIYYGDINYNEIFNNFQSEMYK